MCCFADDGKVVKAVSVIRDNWDTEEVVLEELTVFQVRRCKETGPPQCETVTQMCPVQTGAVMQLFPVEDICLEKRQ